ISSTEWLATLAQLQTRVELPLQQPVYLNNSLVTVVTYDLPVLWEEALALFVNDLNTSMADIVKYEVFTLMGICCAYTNRLTDAESHFQEAIQLIEKIGLETDLIACDLYNSIAQLLLAKHKSSDTTKKERCREIAVRWLQTDEGRAAVKAYAVKHPHQDNAAAGLSPRSAGSTILTDKAHADNATRNAYRVLLNRRMKQVLRQEADASTGELLAAHRYLMRSFDIQERA